MVWFEKVPEGEAPWWDDEDDEDDEDDSEDEDEVKDEEAEHEGGGGGVLRLRNGATPPIPSTCSEASHLAAVAAAEAELALLDFSQDGSAIATVPTSSLSSYTSSASCLGRGGENSGDLSSSDQSTVVGTMQQQVGELGAYAANSLREGALLARDGLRETLGTPLIAASVHHPPPPSAPPLHDGREFNEDSKYSSTTLTPLARAKLRAQQQLEEKQKEQHAPPRVRVEVMVKPSEESGGVGGTSGAALRQSLSSGAGAGYGGTVREHEEGNNYSFFLFLLFVVVFLHVQIDLDGANLVFTRALLLSFDCLHVLAHMNCIGAPCASGRKSNATNETFAPASFTAP